MADGSMYVNPLRDLGKAAGDSRELRNAFGQFATGVTVVTAMTREGPVGMTANSFSSVSLEPALVLWCPAKSSARYPLFAAASHFAVHVMGEQHHDIAMDFARSGQAFEGRDFTHNSQGVPLLSDCLARFECATHQIHDAGDHAIVLGQVEKAAVREGNALVFCQGRFGQFDKEA